MISIVIRVLNEAKHLGSLLKGIQSQVHDADAVEIIVVDSGSTDGTLAIAEQYQTKILKIRKDEFSFGRSLNIGCTAARGDCLVFISGHCIPYDANWLARLVAPIRESSATYTYGRQIGGEFSKFGEKQVFSKYYPSDPGLAQNGFFCNNANAALLRSAWRDYQFNEDLTGLEDMDLAKRLVADNHRVLYVPEAIVYHLHDENWGQIKTRYEREALALQFIMPEVNFYFSDFLRYLASSIVMDLRATSGQREVLLNMFEIFNFRLMQYWGTYRGNHLRRELSRAMKEHYFYPSTKGIPKS